MDDQTPATKADLKQLELSMKADVQVLLKQELQQFEQNLDKKFMRIHEDIDLVLTVLTNVKKDHDKTLEKHDTRITRLETLAV